MIEINELSIKVNIESNNSNSESTPTPTRSRRLTNSDTSMDEIMEQVSRILKEKKER